MAKQTIVSDSSYVPTLEDMEKVDSMFTENYASVATIEAGTSFALTEYADNAAAVTGGLSGAQAVHLFQGSYQRNL